MNEEQNRHLNDASFEHRLFAELGSIRGQLSNLDGRMAAFETRMGAFETRMGAFETRMGTFEKRLDALETRMDAIEERLLSLEERVDRRFLQTQPIWETVQTSIVSLDQKFSLVIHDLYDVRRDIGVHDKRLKEHERRLNS